MSIQKVIFALYLFAFSFQVFGGDGSTNHGGDGLGITFERARYLASEMLATYGRSYTSDPRSNEKLKRWFQANARTLVQDIAESPHRIVEDNRPHDALTKLRRNAEIELSRASMHKSRITLEDAAMLLIHESAHHLGIADEAFAYFIAARVGESWDALHGPEAMRPRVSILNKALQPPKQGVQSVMMDREIFYWGGDLTTALIFDPARNRWRSAATIGHPAARRSHTLTWTGKEVIVWGGDNEKASINQSYFAESVAYNPKENKWRSITFPAALAGKESIFYRAQHKAIWTGQKLIILGGSSTYGKQDFIHFEYPTEGLSYDPATNNVHIIQTPIPPEAAKKLMNSDIIWTGDTGSKKSSDKILFFSAGRTSYFYDPETGKWDSALPPQLEMHRFVVVGLVKDRLLLVDNQPDTYKETAVINLNSGEFKRLPRSILAPTDNHHQYLQADGERVIAVGRTWSSLHIFDVTSGSWRVFEIPGRKIGSYDLVWTGESFIGGLGEFRVDLPR